MKVAKNDRVIVNIGTARNMVYVLATVTRVINNGSSCVVISDSNERKTLAINENATGIIGFIKPEFADNRRPMSFSDKYILDKYLDRDQWYTNTLKPRVEKPDVPNNTDISVTVQTTIGDVLNTAYNLLITKGKYEATNYLDDCFSLILDKYNSDKETYKNLISLIDPRLYTEITTVFSNIRNNKSVIGSSQVLNLKSALLNAVTYKGKNYKLKVYMTDIQTDGIYYQHLDFVQNLLMDNGIPSVRKVIPDATYMYLLIPQQTKTKIEELARRV